MNTKGLEIEYYLYLILPFSLFIQSSQYVILHTNKGKIVKVLFLSLEKKSVVFKAHWENWFYGIEEGELWKTGIGSWIWTPSGSPVEQKVSKKKKEEKTCGLIN